jgi:hypothetical protein
MIPLRKECQAQAIGGACVELESTFDGFVGKADTTLDPHRCAAAQSEHDPSADCHAFHPVHTEKV